MKTFIMPTGEILKRDFPQFKTPYNHDTNFESERTATFTPEKSLTKQEFKEETDINVILQRFMKTGEPPALALPEHFADTTDKTTYFEMASAAAEANELFYTLPAALRAQHLNDPTRWADQVVNAIDNHDGEALIALGVARATVKPPEGTSDLKGATPAPSTPQTPSGGPKPDDKPSEKTDSAK